MKILDSKTFSAPKWMKVLTYVFFNIIALIFLALNIYFGIVMLIFINWLVYKMIKNIGIMGKWVKKTLEKDPFFQNNNFALVSYSQYSLIAVSDSIFRLVNIKSTITVHRTTYDISDIYINYPRQGVDILLNGKNVYHFDIPMANIKSAEPIVQGDAGGFGVLNSLNFSIRIKTLQDEIFDIDTPFSKEFSEQINFFISPIK
jgi:hypothetical protein